MKSFNCKLYTHLVTIVAKYMNALIFVFQWHWQTECLVVEVFPKRRHVYQRGLAGGTSIVAGGQQLVEAHLVQQVSTVGNMAGNTRSVDVSQANRTMGSRDILHTLQKNGVNFIRRGLAISYFQIHLRFGCLLRICTASRNVDQLIKLFLEPF